MILEKIKNETSASHHQLEESKLLKPITTPDLTLAHYQKILKVFYGYFYPLEKEIDHFEVLKTYLPDYTERRKARMLKDDLENLSGSAADTEIRLTQCTDLPAIRTAAQAFGCLYVLEGSTLGGKMIAKCLDKNLGLSSQHGASFFNGYGQDTGNKWKLFQQALNRFSQDSYEDQEIIKAANETFYKFEKWLSIS